MSKTDLAAGRFGDADEICRASAGVFAQFGYPESASQFSVHPMLDKVAWHSLRGSTREIGGASLTEPVVGDPYQNARWFERDHPQDVSLHSELIASFPADTGQPEVKFSIDYEFAEIIVGADQLLEELTPELWRSIRPFIVRVFDANSPKILSATLDDTGGAVLLGKPAPDDGARSRARLMTVAEGLMHEGAHCKSYRLFRSFNEVAVPDSPEFIDIPWWRTPDSSWSWDVDRAVVACHVYTHLAQLYGHAAARDEAYGSKARVTAFRAHYLANVLLQLSAPWLDDEWLEFIRWTSEAIPPVQGLNASGEEALRVDVRSFALFPATLT